MCGRFVLTTPASQLETLFDAAPATTVEPRWNIAPTQNALILRMQPNEPRTLQAVRWGLIPHWASREALSSALINARAESLAEKPSFRQSLRFRRCLIPANGFYEWKPEGNRTQPHYIHLPQMPTFAFAGLWDHWQGENGQEIESCTIITTAANELLRPLHQRMPVILRPSQYGAWLDPWEQNPQTLQAMLQPFPMDEIDLYPVGSQVNYVRNNDPRCVERVEPEVQLTLF